MHLRLSLRQHVACQLVDARLARASLSGRITPLDDMDLAELYQQEHVLKLLSPVQMGDLHLRNRMVMSAMTRSRAVAGNVPSPLAPTQRRGEGLHGLPSTAARKPRSFNVTEIGRSRIARHYEFRGLRLQAIRGDLALQWRVA